MSKNDKKGVSENSADALLELLLKQGAVEINLDRTMYSADKCENAPVVGYIVDLLDMPPIDMGKDGKRDWQAFVVLATYETKGIDREGNVITVKPGEEIVVPATFQIQHALKRFAKDPAKMHELAIAPKVKLDIGGGKNFWTYRVIATGNTKERGVAYALPGAPTDTKALPPGTTVPHDPTAGEVRETSKVGATAAS